MAKSKDDGPERTLDTPLAASSRADEITDRLITAIAVGEYLPGARLPSERDLAESLHVGRMTVRTAIGRLVDQGLLATQRGRAGGSFVREQWTDASNASVQRTLTSRWESLRDTCEAMVQLHGAIARAAAENRNAADAAVLRERLDAYRAAESGRASQKADARLHLAIAEASHNLTLTRILLELEAQIGLGAPAHLWGFPEGMQEMELRALADHERLVEAICGQRPAEAATIGVMHARIDIELLEAALTRAGAEAGS
ncbi:GntR family transcriptional regulator [Arthrobacter sp. AL08]|uniref:FadR/GntR family transcriptional regulator n=1 Tax=Micrococcaceae TaxID=1268 RepID=UPI001CFF9A1C|nr:MULTISPECIES: GntR family transcriptional regulator [Micrococcaceae]MCB5282859.1 putative L-lactate dehydrogenase operon regulatory protein [Arthrobacter sp. ES1]MDI3240160.1 GntR family transcriptional regulator [Arthrobacter sp. AL05]MDI3276170.1 GntR family transcriptional regulator [Arthrobacter sp. AL08]MDJ0353824.1 GntR family transcriptional regulator [Pseudarthrobacter sp. PH31-O2]WGZ78959.1 GntR family transcriptional regulator [Arthrobacter sp. EM1]